MGFLKKFFGFEPDEEISEIDTSDILTNEEKVSVYSGHIGSLLELRTKVVNIGIINPKKARELEKEIDSLISALSDNSDFGIPERIVSLQLKIEDEVTRIYGESLISEFEKNNKNMDMLFDEINNTNNYLSSNRDEIRKYEEHLKLIANSDLKLTKVHEYLCNLQIMKSQYRLKMLNFLMNDGVEKNPFDNTIPTEKLMYTEFLIKDFQRIKEQLQELEEHKGELSDNTKFDFLNERMNLVQKKLIGAAYTGEPEVEEIFDSFDDLKSFKGLKLGVNYECEYLKLKDEREIEAQEKQKLKEQKIIEKEEIETKASLQRQAEINSLKNLSNDDIKKEIDRIENDVTADGNKYINILEYQKKVARAKGLLSDEDEYISDKLEYIECQEASRLHDIINNGNREGINYDVLLNSHEYGNNTNLIIVSKSDKKKMMQKDLPKYNMLYNNFGATELGSYPVCVLNMMEDAFNKRGISKPDIQNINKKYCLSANHNAREEYLEGVYDILKRTYLELSKSTTLSNPDLLKDIKCYITIPMQRNFIPILQEMKDQELRYYFEPTPNKRNTQYRDKLNIYFDRKDLEKYKQEVEPKISTIQDGIIEICGHNFSFNDAILKECEFPEKVMKEYRIKEKE